MVAAVSMAVDTEHYPSASSRGVLQGRLTEPMSVPSNTAMVYIASTKADFEYERQMLWSETLPELQTVFLSFGLDVVFVDAHQGTALDHAYDRDAFDLHLQEIRRCCSTSAGLFFLGFVGDQLGPTPLPPWLSEVRFNHIKRNAIGAGKDTQVLDEWYPKDTNYVPTRHTLRPLHYKYSQRSIKNGIHKESARRWKREFHKLQEMLTACSAGNIGGTHNSQNTPHFNDGFNTALEEEIYFALSMDPMRCLLVLRNINDIDPEDDGAETYIKLSSCEKRDEDLESREHVRHFKEDLCEKINESNRYHFQVDWRAGEFDPRFHNDHQEYIEQLHTTLLLAFQENIVSWLSQRNALVANIGNVDRKLYHDVLSHYQQFQKYTTVPLYGIKETLSKLVSLIDANRSVYHQVLLISGEDGCGKSSLLVKLCQDVSSYFDDPLVLFRSVLYTDSGNTSLDLQRSLCAHLQHILNKSEELNLLNEKQIMVYFNKLLELFAEQEYVLFIAIDGVEMLRTARCPAEEQLDWLALSLPPNIHVIITLTSSKSTKDTSRRLRTLLPRENYIKIPSLGAENVRSLIADILSNSQKKLTQEQSDILIQTCQNAGNPLLTRILCEQASKWSSFDKAMPDLPVTLEELVPWHLQNIEIRLGRTLVEHVVRYLCCANRGLSEAEIADLLSCNNDILVHAYPGEVPELLRCPHQLWLLLRKDLGLFLRESYQDRKSLFCWSHRIIRSGALQRCCYRLTAIKKTHKDLSELFLETWLDTKPLVVAARGIRRLDDACRRVCPQPLLYSEFEYNRRRLSELWYQLLHAGDVNSFLENSFFNFEYLLARLHSTSIQSLILDMQSTFGQVLNAELFLLLRCITQGSGILSRDPLQLASELIGRLRQVKDAYAHIRNDANNVYDQYPMHVDSLVQQCMEWCDSYSLPILVPLSSWLPDPRTPLVLTLESVSGVNHLSPTLNGQHIFCATDTNHILMYHVPSKKLIKTLSGHSGTVTCLRVSHSSKLLVSGSSDSAVAVWDVATGTLLNMNKEHEDSVISLAISQRDTFVVTGSRDKTFKIMTIETGQLLRTKALSGPVTAVALNRTDTLLAATCSDKWIHIWDLEDFTQLCVVDEGITCPARIMALSEDNTFLLIGCDDNSLHVKAFTTGRALHTLQGHCGKITCLVLSRDSIHAVVGCADGLVYVYNLRSRELLDTLHGHDEPITSLAITHDEHFILSAAKDKVNIWTFYKRHKHDSLNEIHMDEVTCIGIARDDKKAITGGKDCSVKLWNLDICVFSADLEGHSAPVTCVALADDEAFAVSGSEDTTVKVWSITMACIITDYQEHDSPIEQVLILTDNERILSSERAGFIRLWQAEDGHSVMTLVGPTLMLTMSPDSQFAVSGEGDNWLKVWRVDDGILIQTITHNEGITCVSYSTDSRYVVTGSKDMSVKVWEASTGKLTQVLVEHEDTVSCVAVTESNRHVVSGSLDKRLLIWSLSTGLVEHRLEGHTGPITAVRVTLDGTCIISGSRDASLRVWSMSKGTPISTFMMHVPVMELMITHNGAHVIVKLERHVCMPLLCLHNSPAGDVKSQSQVSIQLTGDNSILPIRPKPVIVHRTPLFPPPKKRNHMPRPSVSTIPEIIQVSPMKSAYPLREVVLQQDSHKDGRSSQCLKTTSTASTTATGAKGKKSSVCSIL